jgi:hypothetical protein
MRGDTHKHLFFIQAHYFGCSLSITYSVYIQYLVGSWAAVGPVVLEEAASIGLGRLCSQEGAPLSFLLLEERDFSWLLISLGNMKHYAPQVTLGVH